MKTWYVVALALIILLLGGLTSFAASRFASNYLDKQKEVSEKPFITICSQKFKNHTATIENSVVKPKTTKAKLCDTLTITNKDDNTRKIAFGKHDHHQAYDGVVEKILEKGQSVTVTLNEAGSFKFHDHFEDKTIGYFTVSK